jgi:hypothetical protein
MAELEGSSSSPSVLPAHGGQVHLSGLGFTSMETSTSSIPLDRSVSRIEHVLRTEPPAWNPYG